MRVSRYPDAHRPLVIPCLSLEDEDLRADVGFPDRAALERVDEAVGHVINLIFGAAHATENECAVLIDAHAMKAYGVEADAADAVWRALIGDNERIDGHGAPSHDDPRSAAVELLLAGRPPPDEVLSFSQVFSAPRAEWRTAVRAFVFNETWATVVAWDADDDNPINPAPLLLGFARRAQLWRAIGTILATNEYCWVRGKDGFRLSEPAKPLGLMFFECMQREEIGDGPYARYQMTRVARQLIDASEQDWRAIAAGTMADLPSRLDDLSRRVRQPLEPVLDAVPKK